MSKLSIKAILLGSVVDVGASLLLGLFETIAAATRIDRIHTPPDQFGAALAVVMHRPLFLAVTMLTGIMMSLLGGYVAGRLAKHDEMLNGILSVWLCVLIGIATLIFSPHNQPLLFDVLDFLLAPAAALLGGYLSFRQHKQNPSNVSAAS